MSFSNKSILFVCAGYSGGIGKILKFVSSQCLEVFGRVIILYRSKGTGNFVPDGVEEIEVPTNTKKMMPVWRFNLIKSTREEIKKLSPDIVCCFGSEMAVMVAISMLGIKNVKLIQAERGDPYSLNKLWSLLVRWAFGRADNCVFQLEKQGSWFGDKILSKSVVIPNAYIPTGKMEPFNGEREKNIVSVGRFVYEKRHEILIKAFKKVHDRHPQYKLILYGDGTDAYKFKYESLIKEYHLENNVELPGYINNTMRTIKNASVFVLSSLYEGMPNTLIEALAAGVPTVSTDCTPGGPDFLTDNGRRGLLVPVDDVDAMTNAICSIIESPEISNKLSKMGQEIIPLLDIQRIGSLWIDFFKDNID